MSLHRRLANAGHQGRDLSGGAGRLEGDADMLTTWYSGWYNGLARKHYLDFPKGKEVEHEVIIDCKANPDQLIIEAIAVVFKDLRTKLGIEMKP
jgi:hypothetical protein